MLYRHVLGAAMFMVEIDDTRVLYTGDFSRQTDRHLMVAELPVVSPDVLIVESTYGKQVHEPREARERRFTESVSGIVSKRRGRCLLPVFALGRAQELLLILVRARDVDAHVVDVDVVDVVVVLC